VDLADLAAVAGVLAPVAAQEGGYKATGPLAGIAAVHARLRGGADLALPYLLQDPPEIWLFGGSGDDFLVGTPGADRLLGGSGHDTLLGLGGATMSCPAARGRTSWWPGWCRWRCGRARPR